MVVSYTGSWGVAATDALSMSGMRLSEIDEAARGRLKKALPPYVGLNNPVDCTFDMNALQLKEIIEAGLDCDDIGSFIVIIQAEILLTYAAVLPEIDFRGKPSSAACPARNFPWAVSSPWAKVFPFATEEAVAALQAMYHYGVKRRSGAACWQKDGRSSLHLAGAGLSFPRSPAVSIRRIRGNGG